MRLAFLKFRGKILRQYTAGLWSNRDSNGFCAQRVSKLKFVGQGDAPTNVNRTMSVALVASSKLFHRTLLDIPSAVNIGDLTIHQLCSPTRIKMGVLVPHFCLPPLLPSLLQPDQPLPQCVTATSRAQKKGWFNMNNPFQ